MSAKAVKTMILRLPGLIGFAEFAFDDVAEGFELGVARRAHLLGGGKQRGEPVAVLDQVLPPANQVHVLQQHFHFAPDQKALESRVVDVHIFDVDFFNRFGLGFDLRERGLHVGKLALDGEGEGGDGAFHALEDVDAQQVNQALFAVHLPEEAFAAANLACCISRRRRPACAAARSAAARRR